jgi:hypothetical protein
VIAHIAGVPLEEVLPSAGGTAMALLVARGWILLGLRRLRRKPAA